jgi:predicted nucleic acid-binding protein
MSSEDAHHLVATRLLSRGEQHQAGVVHPMNLAEVLVGPSRRGKENQAAGAIVASGIETIVTDAEAPIRLARLRATTKLRLPDCCVLDAALETGYPMATFDDRLARVATSLGITLAA